MKSTTIRCFHMYFVVVFAVNTKEDRIRISQVRRRPASVEYIAKRAGVVRGPTYDHLIRDRQAMPISAFSLALLLQLTQSTETAPTRFQAKSFCSRSPVAMHVQCDTQVVPGTHCKVDPLYRFALRGSGQSDGIFVMSSPCCFGSELDVSTLSAVDGCYTI